MVPGMATPLDASSTSAGQYVLTISEAAQRLGVSTRTIRRWAKAGHLSHARTPGGQFRFRLSDVDAVYAKAA